MVTSSARHRRSARHAAPLVQINCAALPESLAESELFGHVKGAARRLELDPSNLHKLARRLGLK